MENAVVKYLSESFGLTVPVITSQEQLQILLAERINYLIIHDFSSLVHILYRIDVSEQKLKTLLKENNSANAGNIIALLVIERQSEKIKSRQQNGRDNNNIIDENESW